MVEDHKHCVMCGKPTDPDKYICSPSCEELMKQQRKKMSRNRMFMMVFFVVMFVVIILLSLLGQRPSP